MNPKISEFFWIKIKMYYWNHNPPHFHIKYNEYEAFVSIKDIKVLEWQLPPKIEKLVLSWAELYEEELLENWELCLKEKPLNPILPYIK